jgi:hypothetical protein
MSPHTLVGIVGISEFADSLFNTSKIQIGQTIPDHLRASIMRLVQSQAEEEKAEAQALREAQGLPSRERDEWEDYEEGQGVDRLKIGGDGEASGGEEDGDKVVVGPPLLDVMAVADVVRV